jgi:mRNA-degrading endonuclease RelE of RelBE toxin-antitoxin system
VAIVETTGFTRQIDDLLHAESHRLLQLELADRPDRGPVISGSGGLRKIRWRGSSRGKRGGMRVIYYWARDRLTADQLKVLRRVVKEAFE